MNKPAAEPDKYSNAWYRQQFIGFNFALNSCQADYADSRKAVRELGERVEKLEAALAEAMVEIGRQTVEIAELKEGYKGAREAFQKLQKGKT